MTTAPGESPALFLLLGYPASLVARFLVVCFLVARFSEAGQDLAASIHHQQRRIQTLRRCMVRTPGGKLSEP
jgi:hypothetical protein